MRCYEPECRKEVTKTLEINRVVFLLCDAHFEATWSALQESDDEVEVEATWLEGPE